MKNGLKESQEKNHQVVAGIIDDIEIAMVTTYGDNGTLLSRPMQVQEVDADGCLWFFTSNRGEIVRDILRDQNVNVTFAAANKNKYLSASGLGSEVVDRKKMEELWKPTLKAWFKEGLESPELTLLKIDMHKAQFWDAPNSVAVEIAGFVKSLVSDEPFRPGRNEKVDLRH